MSRVERSQLATKLTALCSPDRSEEAWFGWERVNLNVPGTTLLDVGPSIVQTCDC